MNGVDRRAFPPVKLRHLYLRGRRSPAFAYSSVAQKARNLAERLNRMQFGLAKGSECPFGFLALPCVLLLSPLVFRDRALETLLRRRDAPLRFHNKANTGTSKGYASSNN